MKKIVIATLVSGVMATSAFAADDSHSVDASLIFSADNSQAMELAPLSEQEMMETEGAFLDFGFVGSIIGKVSDRIESTREKLSYIRDYTQTRREMRREFYSSQKEAIRTYVSDRLFLTANFISPSN
ncbi:MAG: hypothetical protein SV201_14570 [Pseudomonadota bacterium]|nr:hypothetical protein [Pseudomonadota bacterium]